MAVANHFGSRLSLIFETGIDEEGKPVFRTKNYNNVKPEATTDSLYTVATVLTPLQQHTINAVERTDDFDLQNA